ncbi:hypothetical protein [Pseudomonas fluorescens]|uniref:hypothetical protein n=2 Tax=Pseudomonas TaxID=286 RepID=UPI003528A368
MSLAGPVGPKRWAWGLAFLGLLVWWIEEQSEKEIALLIDEPWEDMRHRSSASIGPAIAGHVWFNVPATDARLRFVHPQYGFTTPLARYFTVSFSRDELVHGVRMSPQVEPLLQDDTLKVALDLQDQWRQSGWVPTLPHQFPPIADTPQLRVDLREESRVVKTYWQAGDLYQVRLEINRFEDYKRPSEERYLILLDIAKPWVKP